MPIADIQVTGLRELSKALRQAGPEHAKALRTRFKELADVVAADARGRVKRRSGETAASIRSAGDNRGASVIGGRGNVARYGWLDFGGVLKASGGRRNTQHRERPARGRYILPALDAHRDDLAEAARLSVEDTKQEAGL